MLTKIKLPSENSLGKFHGPFQMREEKAVVKCLKSVNSPLIILKSQHTPSVTLSYWTTYCKMKPTISWRDRHDVHPKA
jgi:hypothetical protein